VSIDVALVFLRPHFSVLHNAESDYGSRGPYACLMDLKCLRGGHPRHAGGHARIA
jgi:hypothetical protein